MKNFLNDLVCLLFLLLAIGADAAGDSAASLLLVFVAGALFENRLARK